LRRGWDEKMVYLVTSGQYSDYKVMAVFTSQERADVYATGCSEVNDVEEYELDPIEPPRLQKGMEEFSIIMEKDGLSWVYPSKKPEGAFVEEHWQVWASHIPGHLQLRITVVARDEDHAVKIANERRASLIATGNFREGVSSETFK